MRGCSITYVERMQKILDNNKVRIDQLSDKARAVVTDWRKLRNALPRPSNSISAPVFHSLERCADNQCLCSLYKPVHRLRVCKGCYCAAYCSAQCQER